MVAAPEFLTWGPIFTISWGALATLCTVGLAIIAGARVFRNIKERTQQNPPAYAEDRAAEG